MEHERIRCLIVDDEPIAIDGLIYYISRLDFIEMVQTCSSAVEAEEILRTNKIDLMFLDINMPHLKNGILFHKSHASFFLKKDTGGDFCLPPRA